MTFTGAFPRALAAARPPKPPPTITTRGIFDVGSSVPLVDLRLASFIQPFLKRLRPEISENRNFYRKARWRRRRTAARVQVPGLLYEATMDWRLTQTPYKYSLRWTFWRRSKLKRARNG